MYNKFSKIKKNTIKIDIISKIVGLITGSYRPIRSNIALKIIMCHARTLKNSIDSE